MSESEETEKNEENATSRSGPAGPRPLVIVAAVALGGGAGSVARFAIENNWVAGPADFPWATTVTNIVGCTVMGLLMVVLGERHPNAPAVLNPMLGTGFLGGFTTFSSYTDDVRRLIDDGQVAYAMIRIFLTVVAALLGVWLGTVAGRALLLGPAAVRGGRVP